MRELTILWVSLGLSTAAFVLIWLGTSVQPSLLWVGLVLFLVAMLLALATRYLGEGG